MILDFSYNCFYVIMCQTNNLSSGDYRKEIIVKQGLVSYGSEPFPQLGVSKCIIPEEGRSHFMHRY